MSERKSVIVDGSSLSSTRYYTVLPRETMPAKTEEGRQKCYDKILHSKNGMYTSRIFGVSKVTASLLKKQTPGHIAFVFGKTRNISRRKLYPDYKGTRSVTPEPLRQQFVLPEQILGDVGFRVLYDSQFEADDYAGSLAMKFGDQIPMMMVTKDHDYLQFVSGEHSIGAWMVQSKQEKADELYNKYYAPYGLGKRGVNPLEKTFESITGHIFTGEGV